MQSVSFTPIGFIYTPFTKDNPPPRQGSLVKVHGTVKILDKYLDGLAYLDKFSHIILIFYLHLSFNYSLIEYPSQEFIGRGLFATRSPRRPNPIGLTICKLLKRNKNCLTIVGIDVFNKTPLLDIKPYIRKIDSFPMANNGWLKPNEF